MSKGSKRRPKAIPQTTFESNWERTFGRKVSTERALCMQYREYGVVCLKDNGHEGHCGGHLAGCHNGFNCDCPGAVTHPIAGKHNPPQTLPFDESSY